jgi:hypothetical protein
VRSSAGRSRDPPSRLATCSASSRSRACCCSRWRAPRAISTEGLREPATWLVGALLFALVYVVVGTLNAPFWGLFPSPQRALWCVLATLLLLPYFGASEWLLRGSGATGLWLPALGKLLTLIVVGASAVAGLLPFVILLGMASIALFFAFFELVALRLARVMPNPWLAALFQAAFTGTALASVFPWDP